MSWLRVALLLTSLGWGVHSNALDIQTHRIEMRDGARLFATVILPGDPEREGPWPVVLRRNVYGRVFAVDAYLDVFRGYAAVIGEMRGTGENDGEFRFFEDDGWGELQDGADTVAWVKSQPWCNGRIGTVGGSALGMAQTLMAGATTDLTCQVIEAAPANFYSELFYQGGVMRRAVLHQALFVLGRPAADLTRWKEHPCFDDYWRQFDVNARIDQVNAPALHIGGWWDTFQQATLDHFVARQYHGGEGARGNQRLLMRATTHAPFPPGFAFNVPDYLQVFTAAPPQWNRFMDHWLKGDDNGVAEEPPVQYYVIGDDTAHRGPGWEWRTANHWPPFPYEPTPYYLSANATLTPNMDIAQAGHLSFTFDPDQPVPSLGGADLFGLSDGRYFSWGPWDQRPVSDRDDILRFETPPLDEPLEITGRVRLQLFISSSAVDTDFTAKLIDIYPDGDGREMLMLDSIQRVKFREGYENPLPPLSPDDIVEVEIDLWSISLVFNRGHRIGLHISSSNYPRFEVNPNNGDDFPGAHDPVIAQNTVHVGSQFPSVLMLPVRHPDRDSDQDALADEIEYDQDLDMDHPDTDRDSLPDGWEYQNGLHPASAEGDDGPQGDPDHDGYSNLDEYLRGSNPKIPEGTEPTPGCHGNGARVNLWPALVSLFALVLAPRKRRT